jgi:DNA-directed RNA polymerase specialized sigma24 family protein
MAPAHPDELAKQPARPSAPVQPDVGDGLLPEWATEASAIKGADHVDRLAADFELVTELGWRNFQGPEYEYFQGELVKYGMAVLTAWIRRGLIFHYCKQRGYGGLPAAPAGAFDDTGLVEDLVLETVGKALMHFRDDVLVKGRWDYRKGASLRTFFIGQCLIRFPNAYNDWRRHDLERLPVRPVREPLEYLERYDPSVEQLVVDQVYGDQILGQMKPLDRRIFAMIREGMTQSDIAAELGITTKTVERAVANQRDRMRKERGA